MCYNPLYSEDVMETFLLVYNCLIFVLFIAVMVFADEKEMRPLFFVLSVIQVLDIVRMIRG